MGRPLGHAFYTQSSATARNTVNIALPPVAVRLEAGVTLSLTVHDSLADIRADLTQLRDGPYSTLFNSPAWLESRIARRTDFGSPCIITARDENGTVAFIWPMSICRCFGASILGWLGQDIFAVNLGCYRADIAAQLTGEDLKKIFNGLRLSGLPIDAVHLLNQPKVWNGVMNPMLALGQQLAPNANYERKLHTDYDTLYTDTFSSRERRNHARQRRRLAEHGDVEVVFATTNTERATIIDTFFAFKTSQLEHIGAKNPFASETVQAFYRSALASTNSHGAEPIFCGLRINGKLIATLIGVTEAKRFTTLMSAITLDDIAKASPGQQLLEQLVHHLCTQGIETFDFGPGPSAQKLRWEMQPHALHHSYMAMTARALPATALASARSRVMQKLKGNDRTFRILTQARARLIGR